MFQKIAKEDDAITIKNMEEFLKGKIAFNERDLYEIFEKFDHKRRGWIDKEDFCLELLP